MQAVVFLGLRADAITHPMRARGDLDARVCSPGARPVHGRLSDPGPRQPAARPRYPNTET